MEQFRTSFQVQPHSHPFHLQTPIFSIGSCFANAMGQRLQQNKFSVCVNPFGVIFNPLSIFKLLDACLHPAQANALLNETAMVERQGLWYHYDLHSDFYGENQETIKQKLQESLQSTRHFLEKTQVIILTLGTAYAYFLNANQAVVANCHKVPQKFFDKRLLSVNEIIQGFEQTYKTLQTLNPQLQVILTVSPVRHIKDTIPLNQVSKSTLRLACHHLSERFDQVSYFPAYELLLDDLRDYRFFKADMIHPTKVAEDYIWEKFSQVFMDNPTQDFLKQWGKIKQALNHRSFQPASEAHQKFLRKLMQQLQDLSQQIDVSTELAQVQQQVLS